MRTVTADRTVGELVAEKPSRSRIFEKHRIDYCCGGKKPLSEACDKKGLDTNLIIKTLQAADNAPETDEVNPAEITLNELVDNILEHHHEKLAVELPRLQKMIDKVTKVHGDKDERFYQVQKIFNALRAELESHMLKEEQVLFPIVRKIEDKDAILDYPFGSIIIPINAMEAEHDIAGNALEKIHSLTDGYVPPDWACNTHRAMLDGLQELELDMHKHIHKENNVLFPRALKLEEKRKKNKS